MPKNSWITHGHFSKTPSVRNERGDFLIEAIVSVLVSSIIATAMVQMYTQVRRTGNLSSAQLAATAVAQEVIDHLRALPYDTVADNIGTRNLIVNGGATGDPLFPTALLQDTSAFTTPNGTSTLDFDGRNGDTLVSAQTQSVLRTCDANGAITNTISLTIEPFGTESLRATVTINFLTSQGKPSTFTMSGLLNRLGLTG
jgi:type II secretory pathway pseudopilin PulG